MARVEFWRMGASPVPVSDTGRLAIEFEANGWDGLAVGEAHGILPDPYAALALAAGQTRTLRLGSAVAVPLRSAFLTASAMATIQAISGGRARFCIARGDGAMKVLGQEPMRLGEFTVYLSQVQAYLNGEEVDVDGVATSLSRMPILDNSFRVAKVPVDVAATGPRMVAIASRLADGINFAVGADLARLRQCIDQARSARRDAGLDPDTLEMGCFVQMAVHDGSLEFARRAVKGLVMTHARFSGYEGKSMLPGVANSDHGQIRSAVAAMDATLRTGHRTIAAAAGSMQNEVDFYPDAVDDAFLDKFAIIGTAEACAERLQEIIDLGIRRIYIGTRGVGADPQERNTTLIGRTVLPLLRGNCA